MKKTLLMLCMLLFAAYAQADSASTLRSVELQEQNQSDSATLATLTKNTRVDVLRRLGAWSQVKTLDGKTGWIRMTALRFDADSGVQSAGKSSGNNTLGALDDLLSSGRTSNSATVTTGVRGLTQEDLQNAQANPAELEKAKQYAASRSSAQGFAHNAKLSTSAVSYLPASRGRRSNDEEQ